MTEPAAPPRIDRTERLLNLVVVLLGSVEPVSRATIRSRVPGYAGSTKEDAFERMFERDKDELRSMGIPVETQVDGDVVLGYRIRPEDYAMAPVAFTPAERAVIAVAAQVWGQASLGAAADTALRKLDSTDDAQWAPAGLHGSIHLTPGDAAFGALLTAIRQPSVVQFRYRGAADQTSQPRRVTPWGLRAAHGAWFCVGYDHDRGDRRTFRLSRITGTVESGGKVAAVPPPPDFAIGEVEIIPAPHDQVWARVRVAPGRAAGVRRLAAHPPDATDRPSAPEVPDADPWTADELTVWASSEENLVSTLCGAGADVVVREPPQIVAAVRAGLLAAAAHAYGSPR